MASAKLSRDQRISLTQAMTIDPVPYRYDFSADNNAVDTTDTLKILGVTLDCELNFAARMSEQI